MMTSGAGGHREQTCSMESGNMSVAMTQQEKRAAVDYRKGIFHRIISDGSSKVLKGRTILVVSVLAVMVIVSAISAITSESTVQKLDNTKAVFLETVCIILVVSEYWCRQRIERMMNFVSVFQSTSSYGLPEEEEIMLRAREASIKTIKYSKILFAANFVAMMIMRAIFEGLTGGSWRQLAFSWNIQSYGTPTFILCFLFQVAGIGFSHCIGIMALCAISTIPIQLSAVFDILILGLDHIEERTSLKMKEGSISREESMVICIKESIASHQEILREVISVRPHLQILFTTNSSMIPLALALEVFPLLQGNINPGIVLKAVVFIVIDVICAYFTADALERLAEKNARVGESFYNVPWYTCGIEFRRTLVKGMMFAYSQRMEFTGWHLGGMRASRESFYSAMMTAINFLNVLRKFV